MPGLEESGETTVLPEWRESEKEEQQRAQNGKKTQTLKRALIAITGVVIVAIAAVAFISMQRSATGMAVATGVDAPAAGEIKTFTKTSDPIELIDGKPVIRLFSTTWCPHCQWISKTFDETVQPYVAAGKIVALHWELDTMDDTLTAEAEGIVPQDEYDVFTKFSPTTGVPAFVFGGKYVRVGNGFEAQNNLAAEKAEFKAVIEALLKEAEEAKK